MLFAGFFAVALAVFFMVLWFWVAERLEGSVPLFSDLLVVYQTH